MTRNSEPPEQDEFGFITRRAAKSAALSGTPRETGPCTNLDDLGFRSRRGSLLKREAGQ